MVIGNNISDPAMTDLTTEECRKLIWQLKCRAHPTYRLSHGVSQAYKDHIAQKSKHQATPGPKVGFDDTSGQGTFHVDHTIPDWVRARKTNEIFCTACKQTGANQPTVLVKQRSPLAERRMAAMTSEIQTYQGRGQAVAVPDEVKRLLAPKATDRELVLFCKIANDLGLNPFANELYLIPFGGSHQIVIAVQAYLKRASHNPNYSHIEAGLVVQRNNQYVRTTGTMRYPGDITYGAWCDAYKILPNGTVSSRPFSHEVTLADWNKGSNVWATKPEHMIMTTAIRQCVRMAFPDEFGPELESSNMQGMAVEVADSETIKTMQAQAQPILEATPEPVVVASPGYTVQAPMFPMVCPLHNIEFARMDHFIGGKRTSTLCHVQKDVKGPKNGRVFCEQSDFPIVDFTTGEINSEQSQAFQDDQTGPDGGETVVGTEDESKAWPEVIDNRKRSERSVEEQEQLDRDLKDLF